MEEARQHSVVGGGRHLAPASTLEHSRLKWVEVGHVTMRNALRSLASRKSRSRKSALDVAAEEAQLASPYGATLTRRQSRLQRIRDLAGCSWIRCRILQRAHNDAGVRVLVGSKSLGQ